MHKLRDGNSGPSVLPWGTRRDPMGGGTLGSPRSKGRGTLGNPRAHGRGTLGSPRANFLDFLWNNFLEKQKLMKFRNRSPYVNPGGYGGAGKPPQLHLFVLPHQYTLYDSISNKLGSFFENKKPPEALRGWAQSFWGTSEVSTSRNTKW